MKKQLTLLVTALVIMINFTQAQNTFPVTGSAGVGTTIPDASSVLEVKSSTQGMLLPRMTKAQRNAIVSPAKSLLIFQTDGASGFYYFDGTSWKALKKSDPLIAGTGITITGSTIINAAPDQVVSLTGTGGTSVTGSYPNFTINSSAGSGANVSLSNLNTTAVNQDLAPDVSETHDLGGAIHQWKDVYFSGSLFSTA